MEELDTITASVFTQLWRTYRIGELPEEDQQQLRLRINEWRRDFKEWVQMAVLPLVVSARDRVERTSPGVLRGPIPDIEDRDFPDSSPSMEEPSPPPNEEGPSPENSNGNL